MEKVAQETEEISCLLPFIEVWIKFAYISLQFWFKENRDFLLLGINTVRKCWDYDTFTGHLFSQHNLTSHHLPSDHYLTSKQVLQ